MKTQVRERFELLRANAEEALEAARRPYRIRIQVGSATCENAAGAGEVYEEFRKHIAASGRQDIGLHRTGCTGRCSREPIVTVFMPDSLPVKYQFVNRELVHRIFTSHVLGGQPLLDHVLDGPVTHLPKYELLCCRSPRCAPFQEHLWGPNPEEKLRQLGIGPDRARIYFSSCLGACAPGYLGQLAHVLVRPDKVLYRIRSVQELQEVLQEHLLAGRPVQRLAVPGKTVGRKFLELYGDVAFFNRQTRVALRHNGVLDPTSIEEYFHYRGFEALATVLERNDPGWVIDQVTRSKLRGRGGAGYPTGRKWALAAASSDPVRYIICNADEGDPGAFMDRSMLESDPFNVIEGMIIGAFAIRAHRGFVYVRAEYPLAVERVENAIAACRQWGLLGRDILGSGFDFDIEVRLGAGAFVCGEETALIHSIEGERGQPRPRPPYPSERGLWGKPTVINNVETFANVPAIINYGPEWFSRLGTEESGGTKVFALAGKVSHTGLVEVPMGTPLRDIVMGIGGGPPGGKKVKAVQTGGPAGGCIPEPMLDLPVDFGTLTKAGSIMGSGGMIVMDETDCMVDIAKYFMEFTCDESCGKCTPCREGTKRMLEILDRITTGRGSSEDLEKLERLGKLIKKSSLCGLGRAAPNPVLSTLTHFRDEYVQHVVDKRCPAKKCKALVTYEIDPEKCVGCTVCARNCPVSCISGVRRQPHVIDQTRCIKCGRCFEVCRFDAVIRN
ncbi:MAG: NADH-ubiquinone oxidoreductase-F iron-sulfur binding region domain-containing protein [Thermoguttaceae bacterium]|nr:NADH-ubiquinone oxidoreductase-F iron-sulfur binding region domain-containing protein [Thermoguttaceae bacterium]